MYEIAKEVLRRLFLKSTIPILIYVFLTSTAYKNADSGTRPYKLGRRPTAAVAFP